MTTDLVAEDVMSESPAFVLPTAPIRDAVNKLQELDVRHLVVINADHELLGMLSDRDLRGPVPTPARHPTDLSVEAPVSRLMSSDVISVGTSASLREIAELMIDHKVGAVPVVDQDGRVVGIVSYIDVLRKVEEQLEE